MSRSLHVYEGLLVFRCLLLSVDCQFCQPEYSSSENPPWVAPLLRQRPRPARISVMWHRGAAQRRRVSVRSMFLISSRLLWSGCNQTIKIITRPSHCGPTIFNATGLLHAENTPMIPPTRRLPAGGNTPCKAIFHKIMKSAPDTVA